MGTIYIDRNNMEIRVEGNSLVFYEDGVRTGCAPIKPLDRVVIIGNKKIETSVLNKLASNNVSVVFLTGRSMSFRGILHGRLHNNALLRLKQYALSQSNFCLQFAKELVETKIRKQVALLEEIRSLTPDKAYEVNSTIAAMNEIVKQASGHHDIDSLRGLEGIAANLYFKNFIHAFPPSLNFKGRVRRPPTDPVNSILSLTYTLVHFELVREIQIIGLDPIIGFYHSFEYGRESLACDLVEEYRPDVDRFVLGLFKERILRSDDFHVLNDEGRSGCYLKKGKRKDYYFQYESWAKENRPKWKDRVIQLSRRLLNA